MRPEPTERQVLYALVAGGLLVTVGVLAGFAAVVGVPPGPWSVGFAALWLVAVASVARSWRNTARTLAVSVGIFVVWVVGTLLGR